MTAESHEPWDSFYREVNLDDIPWRRDGKDDVISCLAQRKPGTLLDVGCGTGEKAIRFAQLGFTVTGIDISPTAIEWARTHAAEAGVALDFRVHDAERIAELNTTFDYVIDFGCFHSLPVPVRKPYIAGVKTLLKPASELCIFAWDRRNTEEFQNRPAQINGATDRCFSFNEIAELFGPELEIKMHREVELEKPEEILYATFYLLKHAETA